MHRHRRIPVPVTPATRRSLARERRRAGISLERLCAQILQDHAERLRAGDREDPARPDYSLRRTR